jgi:hypothetical protein
VSGAEQIDRLVEHREGLDVAADVHTPVAARIDVDG